MQHSPAPIRHFVPLFLSYLAIIVLSVLVLQIRGIGISHETWKALATTTSVAFGIAAATHVFKSDAARLAGMTVAAFIAMMAPLSVMSYAFASLGAFFPLQDGTFAAIDRAMGFDWLATVAFVNEWPTAVEVMKAGYHYTIAAVMYALVFLNVVKRIDRLTEFFWAMMLTCVAANVLSAVMPALGAYVWYAPAYDIRNAISADSGVWHLKHFEALRDGSFKVFDLASTEGLVTFPSYHTAMALLIPLAMRGYGAITAVAWVVASIVVASTVPIGGHYLIDVIAGGLLAVACVHMLARVRKPVMSALDAPAASGALSPAMSVSQSRQAS